MISYERNENEKHLTQKKDYLGCLAYMQMLHQ